MRDVEGLSPDPYVCFVLLQLYYEKHENEYELET